MQKFHNLPTGSKMGQPDTSFYVYESTWGWQLVSILMVRPPRNCAWSSRTV